MSRVCVLLGSRLPVWQSVSRVCRPCGHGTFGVEASTLAQGVSVLHVLSPTAPEERDKQHALEDGDHL